MSQRNNTSRIPALFKPTTTLLKCPTQTDIRAYVRLQNKIQTNVDGINNIIDSAQTLVYDGHKYFEKILKTLAFQKNFAERAMGNVSRLYEEFRQASQTIPKLVEENNSLSVSMTHFHTNFPAMYDVFSTLKSKSDKIERELDDLSKILHVPFNFVERMTPRKLYSKEVSNSSWSKLEDKLIDDICVMISNQFGNTQTNIVEKMSVTKKIIETIPNKICVICTNDMTNSFDKACIFTCGHFVCEECLPRFHETQNLCHSCRIPLTEFIKFTDLTSNFLKYEVHKLNANDTASSTFEHLQIVPENEIFLNAHTQSTNPMHNQQSTNEEFRRSRLPFSRTIRNVNHHNYNRARSRSPIVGSLNALFMGGEDNENDSASNHEDI